MFYAQSTAKGHIRAKQKCIPSTSKILFHYLKTHSIVEDLENFFDKIMLNEPGRQKLGRYRSPVSRHSIQSYILIMTGLET